MVIALEKLITIELNLIAPNRRRLGLFNNEEPSLIKW